MYDDITGEFDFDDDQREILARALQLARIARTFGFDGGVDAARGLSRLCEKFPVRKSDDKPAK